MDDLKYGTRNKRGDWKPNKALDYPPFMVWPLQPINFLKWLFGYPGYILPWNALYLLVAVVVWFLFTPDLSSATQFSFGWVFAIFARNVILTLIFYGIFHTYFYKIRKQGTTFKFNGRWPDDKANSVFLFNDQTKDNLFWTFAFGVPIWTALEVLFFWASANDKVPVVTSGMNPWYFVAILFIIPLWRDIHFYAIHRMIHWPPLYKYVHKLHHNNVNPGPWSGLSMHPVEHLFYFSNILLFVFVPFHPFHALFLFLHTALVPAQVHLGFDRIVLDNDKTVDMDDYSHYLHHKYFECNYSDGALPLDRWFGTFYDGTPESEKQMMERLKARNAKYAKSSAE